MPERFDVIPFLHNIEFRPRGSSPEVGSLPQAGSVPVSSSLPSPVSLPRSQLADDDQILGPAQSRKGCTSCIVKSSKSRSFFMSCPIWVLRHECNKDSLFPLGADLIQRIHQLVLESQLPHKSVNITFQLVIADNKLTISWGS